jgi:hypothetical protein
VQRLALRQSSHVKIQSQQDVSIQDTNRIGAQDALYPAKSILYTHHSFHDTKVNPVRSKVLQGEQWFYYAKFYL